MSTFKVTVEQITTSVHHPNADRLSLCGLAGLSFQFVTMRDQFKPGDLVVYYPVDSILPTFLIERMGLVGKLAGAERNRVKTVRLRDAISQGLVEPASMIGPDLQIGADVTELLGVTKWEPDLVSVKNATLVPIGTIGLSPYDIEGAERYQDVVEQLLDVRVQVTEKLEGSNLSVTARLGEPTLVGMRNKLLIEDAGKQHPMCEAARRQGLIIAAESLRNCYTEQTTVYGEYLGPGVQSNIYRMTEREIRCFDVRVGDRFLDCERDWPPNFRWVPVLAENVTLREFLDGRTVQQASNGASLLGGVRREGIVIKPMIEMRHPTLGRLIIKQRSPEYLANSDL
jgi:RNA ligase (TIGR02306 family)